MPMPTPNEGETESDFVGRCMGDQTMLNDYPDQAQRAAICYRQARDGRQMTMTGTVELKAAEPGRPPRVSIVAYTGSEMSLEGFSSPVIVDVAGLDLPPTIPLLADHANGIDGIAGSGTPRVIGGAVYVDGTLATTGPGEKVLALHKDGVPFQASIGAQVVDSVYVRAGDPVTVNGRQIVAGRKGLTHVRAGRLREVSIVPLGADANTSVSIAAKGRTMSIEDRDGADRDVERDPIRVERRRVGGIVAACSGRHGEIQARAIEEGWSVEATKAALFDETRSAVGVRAYAPTGGLIPAGGPAVSNKDLLTASCMLMGDHGDVVASSFRAGEQLANGLARPGGWPELCATALRLENRPVPSGRSEVIRAAFSTTSLPSAVGSSIAKVALQSFTEFSQTWVPISRVVDTNNLRAGKALRLSTEGGFEKVGNAGELKHGSVGELAYDYKAETYGQVFGITREDIINDDAGILTDLPRQLGSNAARKVTDLVFSTLTTGAASFFTAGRANFKESGSALAIGSLAAAITALRIQKDNSKIIGMVPTVLLVPAALESTARQLITSTMVQRYVASGTPQQPMGSPFNDLGLEVIVESRLDADSATAWYLFAQPSMGAILVAFLNGARGPHVESMPQEAETLGILWRAYMDVGCNLAEYRAAVKSTGAS